VDDEKIMCESMDAWLRAIVTSRDVTDEVDFAFLNHRFGSGAVLGGPRRSSKRTRTAAHHCRPGTQEGNIKETARP
jgi:hypothetical protein